MKKALLLLLGFFLFIISDANAADRYWVGGTGTWNNPAHWSASSGGPGGATVPAMSDDVYFDQNSFSAAKQTVMLTADGVCRNLSWTGIDEAAIFSAAKTRKLTVYGSYALSPLLMNGFRGNTVFASLYAGNSISTSGRTIIGDWIFAGAGGWLLADDLSTEDHVAVRLQKGSLNTNGKKVVCGSFIGNSTMSRSLELGASDIIISGLWDFSSSSSLTFSSGSSSIIFRDSLTTDNFRSGGLPYNSVSAMSAACSPSGTPCAAFTISIVGTNVTCNGSCDGTATATVTGGSGSFTFDWSPGTPTGDGTTSVTGLCAGTYTIRVTDVVSGIFCFCSIAITEPGVLFDFELVSTTPSCNDTCDATSTVAATGGTPPYSFFWSGGLGTNDTVTNVCAGTYIVDVTDSKGCFNNTMIVIAEPAPLLAPGTATMVSCNGFCDGAASVTVSGGTTPYTFSWTPGTPVGDGTASISSLCPNNYVLTVTDANGCSTTFDTLITEPAVLTLAMSKTNASCGGVCDGTATATVSGGTVPYTYTWSNGSVTTTSSTTNVISGLCAGNYVVVITDANGCTETDSVTITEPLPLTVNVTGTNVTCFGLCNGSATAIVAGGTSPYTFDWSPGAPTGEGTATITNLCPGTYTVMVTDVNGCTTTGTVTIIEPVILAANPSSTDVLCFGVCNGTATAAPTGGTPAYSYNWLPGNPTGDGTPNVSNLCQGTYSVIVTDANGCIDTATVVISQPPAILTNTSVTNVTCNGACNGTATAAPSGGTPGYSFSWSTGATTATVTGLCPGTYTLTVTDANGCVATSTVTITQPNAINVSISATTLDCNGDCDATAVATVTGGTPVFSFDWLPGSPAGDGTAALNSLCAGSYTLNVVDGNGCPATGNVTITQPTVLSLITAASNVSCFGLCNGSAAAIAGGGTPPYTFAWSPGGPGSSISGLCAGTYTVVLTDANGCTRTDVVTITQPNQLLANPSVLSNVTCAALCNGSATSAATGGTLPYIYNWAPGTPTGDGTPTITNLCAGTYTLTVTDSNLCSSAQSVTITQPPVLSAPITGSTSSCNICNGTATVTPSGGTPGYTFLWSDGQTTSTAVGLCPNATYTVIVTDANGCTASNSVTILQTIIINITTSNTTLSCFGACDGIATANASGGTVPYSFLWNGPGGPYVTQTVSGLCAGSYTVTVSDANGCFNTDTVTFTNPVALSVTSTTTNSSCGGICNGTATATPAGGSAPYTYSWNSSPVQTTQTATALCAGNYTVTVTDNNGCTDTSHVTITEPPAVIDNVTITDANCTLADGSISVAPTGGTGTFTYNWGPGIPVGDGTPTITNLLPGAYSLVITSGGCTFNFNYLLNNTAGPTLSMSHTDATCFGACNGTAAVVASGGAGGYIYDWSPGIPAGDLTASVSALCGGITYTVQVTDLVGCITLDTATIINPSLISPNPTISNESCGGACDGSISLLPSGGTPGYSFVWSTGSTSSSVSGLCAGSYTVTVTDANGCDSVLVINITSPVVLSVSLSATNVSCTGTCTGTATATPSGGTAPYTYTWSHGAAFILPNVIGLCPGSYTVTATDLNGCTASDTIVITEPTPLVSSTSQVNASCSGVCDGIAIVTASGGTFPYSYFWNPVSISNDTATSLCAGSYNATVTDANGCVSSPPAVVITEPTPIIPNASSSNPSCFGSCNGSAIAIPTGGTAPYSYSWNTAPVQFTQTATGLCAGSYTVTVTDSLGCSNTDIVTLTAPPALDANTSSVSPVCAGACNGSASASPTGGTPGYTFSWSTSATTSSISSLCAGTYTVIVTDLNGCVDTQSVAVISPGVIDVIVGSTPANCGACDGTITISPTSGTAPYTYLWSIGGVSPPAPFAGQGTANVSSVCAGLYTVTVTDVNGCDSTFTIPMNNSGGPTGETVATVDATCNSVCNGSGSVVPIGGVAPYSFLWNDSTATANDTALNLCAGTYFVQVTDANGCIHFSPVTINEPSPILANAVVTSAVCSNVCTGTITVTPTGGTPGYTYVWAPGPITGQGTPSVSALCSGSYTLTITDLNGCTQVDSFTVNQSTPLAATISSSAISCSSACSGSAFVTISTGTPPYTIQWNDPFGQTGDTATSLCAGTYSVEITDSLGCSITLSTTISATPAVAANAIITNAGCGLCDGAATLAPTGGTPSYTYLWSNGNTTASAAGLCAGLYTVDITDSAGCVTNVAIPVSNTSGPTALNITASNVSCSGVCDGAVTSVVPVGGTAPYTLLWIHNGSSASTLSALCAGTYYVQATDANGCSVTDSVVITEPSPMIANQSISAATCGLCDGSISIAPSGGTAPYTVLWNTGSTALTLNSLCAGVYSVTITDAIGCSQTVMIPLNNLTAPSLSISSQNVSCNASCDGMAAVLATGGTAPYAYLWNDVSAQTNDTASGLCAGTYFVEVTGADGCMAIASATITEPSAISFSVANTVDPLCSGDLTGSITTIPSGGTLPYTFTWAPSGGSAATASGLGANSYTVTVTDANGCTATQSVTITSPAPLTISSTTTSSSCNTTADGAIDVTAGGGTLPYTYQWSGGSTAVTEDLSGVLSGSYTITVTDANGCVTADTIDLAATTTVIAFAGNDTSFCESGAITLSAAGSTNGTNFQWFELSTGALIGNTVGLTLTPSNGITTYYVVVDNGAGCADSDTISVTSNPLPTANAGTDAIIVIGGSTSVGGSPTTSTPGATLVWTPSPGLDNATNPNPLANPTTTTTYTVTVTSPEGCVTTDSVLVTVLPTIFIPNGISPNGDGANDVWIIDGIELFPECMVEVYNRWGELLFQSPGYKEKWDGTFKGELLPVGTYYYIIDLHDPLFPDAYTGPITLMR